MNSYTYFANLKKVLETESLAPQELALLQALIMIANNCGWQEELTPRNTVIMTYAGFEERTTFHRWRKRLIDKGLIEFTERKRNAGVYKLGKKLTGQAKTKKPEVKAPKKTPTKVKEPVKVQREKAKRSLEWRQFMPMYLPMDRLSIIEQNELEAQYIEFVDDNFADSTRASLASVDWDDIENPGKYARTVIRNKLTVQRMKLKQYEEKLRL